MIALKGGLAGSVALASSVLAQEPGSVASRQDIERQVTVVSYDSMGAAAHDPCRSTSREARRFYSANKPRWDAIEAALRSKYGQSLADQFGIVIPEGCVHMRQTGFKERRSTYEIDIGRLEQTLGIGG